MLLRIAIGWHFLNEGMEKINPSHGGGKPFTAEPYLRNATGPLGPYFRGMIPDVNNLAILDYKRLTPIWEADVKRIEAYYRFDEDQKKKADAELAKAEADALVWFQDKLENEKRIKYLVELRDVQKIERDRNALSYQRERAAARRKDLDADRKTLTAPLLAIGSALREAVIKLAAPELREAAGPYVPPMNQLDWINLATEWGLIAMGTCLILGLLTRLAALGGAVFLAQLYLSMPPWPGLPAAPGPSHFFIVNYNLIEMLACLVFVCLPTGQWIGFDALLFGWMRRRGPERERGDAGTSRPAEPARTPHRQPADTGPISIE